MFAEIFLHDWRAPLADRAKSRKIVGPYRYRPARPATGRGFYWERGGANGRGSTFCLRMVTCGPDFAFNEWGEGYQGFIARLPRGRGFMAGATMGEQMAAFLEPAIYASEDDARRAAIAEAEHAAERQREWEESQAECED